MYSAVTKTVASLPLRFTLSAEDPDRLGDVVRLRGLNLAAFTAHPVALFSHHQDEPVGQWHDVHLVGNELRGDLDRKLSARNTRPVPASPPTSSSNAVDPYIGCALPKGCANFGLNRIDVSVELILGPAVCRVYRQTHSLDRDSTIDSFEDELSGIECRMPELLPQG